MFKVLNRDYKQTIEEIEREFPNSHYLVKQDKPMAGEGYLLAVSTNRDSFDDLMNHLEAIYGGFPILSGGFYEGEVIWGELHPIEE